MLPLFCEVASRCINFAEFLGLNEETLAVGVQRACSAADYTLLMSLSYSA